MIKFGHVLRDQSGQIMDRGENTFFLILGRDKANENPDAEIDTFQVLEIGDEGKPMGPITFVSVEKLEQMKYHFNLPKIIWTI